MRSHARSRTPRLFWRAWPATTRVIPARHPAASSAQLGHTQDAAAVIAELLALPGGSVEMTRWYLRRYSDGAARDHMIDGLRKAGLTEV